MFEHKTHVEANGTRLAGTLCLPNEMGLIGCPMLLVGGEKDLQCDPADVARIAALGRGPIAQYFIAGMTHVSRCDEQPAALLGSQRLLARPVEPELLELVADWVRSQFASHTARRLTAAADPNASLQPTSGAERRYRWPSEHSEDP